MAEADLDAATARLAERLAALPPAADAATKRLLAGSEAELRARLAAEEEALIACTRTGAFKAAVRCFAGKARGAAP